MSSNKPMTAGQIYEYVLSHGVKLPTGQVFITKPLYVFKKVYTYDKDVKHPKPDANLEKFMARQTNYGNTCGAIANLVIPKGSIVNLNGCNWSTSTYQTDKKLRVNQAICWNIVRIGDNKEVGIAYAGYDSGFYYKPANAVLCNSDLEELIAYPDDTNSCSIKNYLTTPRGMFDMTTDVCASGIHFFVEQNDAFNY